MHVVNFLHRAGLLGMDYMVLKCMQAMSKYTIIFSSMLRFVLLQGK